MRNLWRAALILIMALAINPAPGPALAQDSALAVARPSWRQVRLTAFTRARAEMPLISEAAGRCQSVLSDVGDVIASDGVFARLDDVFVCLEQEANRVEQRRLQSKLAYLKKEVGRQAKLVAKKSAPQQKLDTLQQDLDQAGLQLQALKTRSKTLAERRARMVIKAPPSWRVIGRSVEPGKWVAAGAVLGKVGDFKTLLVPLALSLAEYQALKDAPRPLSLLEPSSGRTVEAEILRISPAFDPATRKINLDLVVKSGLHEMRGGVRLELTLSLPDPAGAVLLPAAAVQQRYQEHWIRPQAGGEIRVMLLGPGPDGALRISGQGLKPGMRFLLPKSTP